MSEKEEKTGKIKPETKKSLELCLQMASTDAVDLITEAYGQDLFDKDGRGDKVWLYKGAKEALTVIEKLKRVLLDEQTTGNTDNRKVTPEQQATALLEQVSKKLEARKQRPS